MLWRNMYNYNCALDMNVSVYWLVPLNREFNSHLVVDGHICRRLGIVVADWIEVDYYCAERERI